MRVEYVGFGRDEDADEDAVVDGSIDCPKCGLAWAHVSDDAAWVDEETKCPHLRFVISPDGMEYYFNGMTEARLIAAVAAAYRVVNPESEELPPEDAWSESAYDDDFWAAATMDEIDAIFDHTESGIACGPVSHTVLYGAKLGD